MFFLDLAAIVYFIFLLPVPLLWSIFQLNPKWFARFGNWNYAIMTLVYTIVTYTTFAALHLFITQRFGQSPLTLGVGVALVVMGVILGIVAARTLSLTTIIGLPQIHPGRYPSKLVTNGVYAHVRHPRYTSFWMISFGFALSTGLLAMWILFLWSVVGLAVLALLEERELRQRFGQAYRDYMREVPRFFPKI